MQISSVVLAILCTVFTTHVYIAAASSTMGVSFLKQAINMPAVMKTLSLFKHPMLAVPAIRVPHIGKLDIKGLKSRGITCVVLDKDNTLCRTYAEEIDPSVKDVMHSIKSEFPDTTAILSNSVGSSDDSNYEGAALTEKNFGIPVIRHKVKKPLCLDEVIAHFTAKLNRKVEPKEICMVGDRVLTDIVFANQYGLLSILVGPISHWKDHPIAILFRQFELNILLPIIKALGYSRK
jgi:phosphatidylglycerophosphatase GEP4